MRHRPHLFLALLFILASLPTLSFAASVNYPGSMCVRWAGAMPSYYYSFIGNGSATQSLYVDCVAPRFDIGWPGNSDGNGWVRTLDRHYTDNVNCTFVSAFYTDNTYAWSSSTQSTAGSSDLAQQLNFGDLPANSVSHFYYSCRIPPAYAGNQSHITTYRLSQ